MENGSTENQPVITHAELVERAKQTTSVEELAELAASCGIEMTAGRAQDAFDKTHATQAPGEIADRELDDVAGGGCESDDSTWYNGYICPKCGGKIRKSGNAPACCEKGCTPGL